MRTGIPIRGLKTSHATENMIMYSGIDMMNAAARKINPLAPFRNPPTNGMYPKKLLIGDRNIRIPNTISRSARTLMMKVYTLLV